MNAQNAGDRYEIRVDGALGETWSDWFEGLSIRNEPDDGAVLTGPIVDQSALIGLLTKMHSLNLKIVLVRLMGRHEPEALESGAVHEQGEDR